MIFLFFSKILLSNRLIEDFKLIRIDGGGDEKAESLAKRQRRLISRAPRGGGGKHAAIDDATIDELELRSRIGTVPRRFWIA